MEPKHLKTLEFPKILERLAQYTAFSAGKELALALLPTSYLTEAHARQAETTEAFTLLGVKPDVGIGGARDVRPMVARSNRGVILTALELLEVRQTLIAGRNLQRTLLKLADPYPRLADIAQRIAECPGLVNEIGQAIDERGDVKSSASPALARIRRDLETAHSRLMEKLNRLVASSRNRPYLQEALITQREGRYVIPVKSDFKGKIQGIVHDQSASGATVFVEPAGVVELNNQWRQLQIAEADEIQRILAELSAAVSDHGRFINHTVVALADLDLAFAKAKYAESINAVEPKLFDLKMDASGQPVLSLYEARHPLLNPDTVVPIDVLLPDDTRMLVITGPNTGGKTVSLKTVGLLAIMAQAGLRIPAGQGSTLPMFNRIYADIGDEQSIEQSLSTFSSHMTNIVKILAECDNQSLVIVDELGAGTDPIEGSALARAILSHLLDRQVTTFVATHYSELKAFAHTTPGVANASLEFNVATLAPTYHLRIGLPGASNAFAIAQRLGVSPDIINQAQGLVGEDAQKVEAMLAEIKAQVEAAHHQRLLAEVEKQEAEAYTRRLQNRLAEIDAERREILNAARADARREIKAVRQEIRAIQEQTEAMLAQTRELVPVADDEVLTTETIVTNFDAQLAELEDAQVLEAKLSTKPALRKKGVPQSIGPGDQVFVHSFNTIGEVVAVQNGQVEVQLGRFRTSVPLADVELQQKASPQPVMVTAGTIKVPAPESPGMELDLRGQVAEEALLELDKYLDQAFSARLPWVTIIHGKGSGVLRQAVRQVLNNHALVSTYRPGELGEGGEGVTVAKLAVT